MLSEENPAPHGPPSPNWACSLHLIPWDVPVPPQSNPPPHPYLAARPVRTWGHTARAEHHLPGTPPCAAHRCWGMHSPEVLGSRAGPGNPAEKRELSQTPTATSCPTGGPRDPCPPGDAHLVPLLTSTAWEPALTPRSLQRDGVKWVGSTLLHPQPLQPPPTASPQSPES